jgi:hypothetical protein
MFEVWWGVVTPMTMDPFQLALSRVEPFLSANPGTPMSGGAFWNYLCDRDSFFCVEGRGTSAQALSGPEAGSHGLEFAQYILNRAAGEGLCQKVAGEEMWLLSRPAAQA